MPGSALTRERFTNTSVKAPLEITLCVFDVVQSMKTHTCRRLAKNQSCRSGEDNSLGIYFYLPLSVVCKLLWLVKVAGCGVWFLIN